MIYKKILSVTLIILFLTKNLFAGNVDDKKIAKALASYHDDLEKNIKNKPVFNEANDIKESVVTLNSTIKKAVKEINKQHQKVLESQEYKEYKSMSKQIKKDSDKYTKPIFFNDKSSNDNNKFEEFLTKYVPNWKDLKKNRSDNLDDRLIPLVFVSFSMPEELVKNYIIESKEHNAILVLNGLIDNSLKKTALKLKELNKEHLSVIIHPQLFTLYQITKVPTIVLGENNVGCIRNYQVCEKDHKFDKVSGSVTISYAIEKSKEEGDLRKYLKVNKP